MGTNLKKHHTLIIACKNYLLKYITDCLQLLNTVFHLEIPKWNIIN